VRSRAAAARETELTTHWERRIAHTYSEASLESIRSGPTQREIDAAVSESKVDQREKGHGDPLVGGPA
jgi:hypothetical protein